MKYDVFISYSRKDTTIINQFVSQITAAGYSVWIDHEGIYSGDEFVDLIVDAIEDSKIVLFFSSVNSNASKWTVREISYAQKKGKTIIPIKIDKSEYPKSIEFRLINIDFIQYDSKRSDLAIKKLMASLASRIGDHKTPEKSQTSPRPQNQQKSSDKISREDLTPEQLTERGDGYAEDLEYEKAVTYYRLAAERGYAPAQFKLGECYRHSFHGVKQDYKKAVIWFNKAAEQGYADAKCSLAVCYNFGNGVARNYAKGRELLMEAISQGNAHAHYVLGLCYNWGIGVDKNYKEAAKWFHKAIELNDFGAKIEMGYMPIYSIFSIDRVRNLWRRLVWAIKVRLP